MEANCRDRMARSRRLARFLTETGDLQIAAQARAAGIHRQRDQLLAAERDGGRVG